MAETIPIKFIPVFMVFLFFGVALFYTSVGTENKIEFGSFGIDSSIGTLFSIFLAIAVAYILLIKKLVEFSKKDRRNVLLAYVTTELPAILGFVLAIISANVMFYYPFGFLSLAYFFHVNSQLDQTT